MGNLGTRASPGLQRTQARGGRGKLGYRRILTTGGPRDHDTMVEMSLRGVIPWEHTEHATHKLTTIRPRHGWGHTETTQLHKI